VISDFQDTITSATGDLLALAFTIVGMLNKDLGDPPGE
jgi:hypothetical protein